MFSLSPIADRTRSDYTFSPVDWGGFQAYGMMPRPPINFGDSFGRISGSSGFFYTPSFGIGRTHYGSGLLTGFNYGGYHIGGYDYYSPYNANYGLMNAVGIVGTWGNINTDPLAIGGYRTYGGPWGTYPMWPYPFWSAQAPVQAGGNATPNTPAAAPTQPATETAKAKEEEEGPVEGEEEGGKKKTEKGGGAKTLKDPPSSAPKISMNLLAATTKNDMLSDGMPQKQADTIKGSPPTVYKFKNPPSGTQKAYIWLKGNEAHFYAQRDDGTWMRQYNWGKKVGAEIRVRP